MDMTSVFAEIVKSTPQDDGSLVVYGKATGSDLDMDEQRCDPKWLNTAMPEWFRTAGNVREQHDAKRAVGKAIEHESTADGSHMIRARIVDPLAKAKVEAGILTGFSIGIKAPRIDKSADAKNGTIVGGQIVEVSLVDRPCLPTATLMVCKAATPGWEGSPADLDEELGLVKCEELVESDEAVEKSADVDESAEKAAETDEQKSACCAECAAPGDACCASCEPVEKGAGPAYTREQALELVESILAKAAPGKESLGVEVPAVTPPEELPDIMGAKAAIAIIAQLIQSEAADMVCAPNEDYDIECLMQAVSALRVFILREKGELGGDPNLMYLAADAEKAEVVEKAKYTAEELRAMLADGKAMKNVDGDPSYPIGDVEDLENAIHAVGRGKGDHDAIRSYIKGRAKALGKSDLIPDSWSGSSKAADPELVEALTELADTVTEKAADATKTVEPEAVKAVTFDAESLLKALEGDLEKADSPLRKLFESIAVESTTELVEASTKSAAEALGELSARLEKVEGMATPGGPALRRTEAEIKRSRQQDLELMASAEERKANAPGLERDLRQGYLQKAAAFRAQANAI